MKNTSSKEREINNLIQNHLPTVQAIYLFGSYGTGNEMSKSDVDIALLLPHDGAKAHENLHGSALHSDLERLLERRVDLVNLRRVDLVFQNEIITSGRRIFCGDALAADEFEVLTLSLYQKLNEERGEIVEDAIKTGRFHAL